MKGDECTERSDVNDPSVALLRHCFSEDLTGAEGSGQIGLHDPVPFAFRALQGRLALCDPGAVHQNIDLTEGLENFCMQRFQRLPIEDIGRPCECATAQGPDLFSGLLHLIDAPRSSHNISVGFGETDCDGAADSRCSPEYHCCFAAQMKYVIVHVSRSENITAYFSFI